MLLVRLIHRLLPCAHASISRLELDGLGACMPGHLVWFLGAGLLADEAVRRLVGGALVEVLERFVRLVRRFVQLLGRFLALVLTAAAPERVAPLLAATRLALGRRPGRRRPVQVPLAAMR